MNGRKRLSAFQKMLAVFVLLAVIIFSILLGLMASGGLGRHDSALPPSPIGHAGPFRAAIAFWVVLAFLSVAMLVVGVALYAMVFATRLFIFDFTRPVWTSFKGRLFLANILVPLPIGLGVGGLVASIGLAFLIRLGVGVETAFMVLFFVPIVLLQLLTIWLRIWMPVETRLARTRLRALGVEPARMDRGILMGISDPSRTSLAKGLIEDDIGMLWITPDELIYEGDNDEFRVRREQLVSIEQVADAGSVSAYFGNANVILTLACDGAPPRRVRLHPESSWTMTGTARASDRLAAELERWKGAAPAATMKV